MPFLRSIHIVANDETVFFKAKQYFIICIYTDIIFIHSSTEEHNFAMVNNATMVTGVHLCLSYPTCFFLMTHLKLFT